MSVQIDQSTGKILIRSGLTSQGQSHQTTFAQIAAEILSVDAADVTVVEGDTGQLEWGVGTYASRAIVVSGNAVALAAGEVKRKALQLASGLLEVSPDDLELKDGNVVVVGSPQRSLTLKQVAKAANPDDRYSFDPDTAVLAALSPPRTPTGQLMPQGDGPGLEAISYYNPESGPTWTSGMHGAIVEVDPSTGQVRYLRYVAVHDCGTMVNPKVVEGQVAGGIAQGIGGTLYERLVYDEGGQLLNANFMDFLIPYATEIPPLELHHLETPTPNNPLGIKGVGEAGVIPVPALTAAAIEDALAPLDIAIETIPIDPSIVLEMINAAKEKSSAA